MFIDAVSGADVRQVLAQRYWYRDELADPVNVLFARRCDGVWLRLFFDAGVFFCSLVKAPELPETVDDYRYDLEDIGISGVVASAEVVDSIERLEGMLTLHFENGRVIRLRNAHDRTHLERDHDC